MANFPSVSVDYGVRKASKPKNRKIVFGDGYEMRFAEGLNNNPKVYNVTFGNISQTQSDTIEDFLDARAADADAFGWTPPEESAGKFVCEGWSKTIPYKDRATIKATFRQVFEP